MLHDPPISMENNEMGGACSTYGGEERVLGGKPEGKKTIWNIQA